MNISLVSLWLVSSPGCMSHGGKQSGKLGQHSWCSDIYYLKFVISNQIAQFINWSHDFIYSKMAYQKQVIKEAVRKAMKRPGYLPFTIVWIEAVIHHTKIWTFVIQVGGVSRWQSPDYSVTAPGMLAQVSNLFFAVECGRAVWRRD